MQAWDIIMRQPLVYRLWMSFQADKKFAPVLAHNDMRRIRRVLDVGCGPGTNACEFEPFDYLGIDINPQYIRDAQRRYGHGSARRRFEAHDATTYTVPPGERFDFILVNSFLHHVNDTLARSVLANLRNLLTDDGHVHIIEVVRPGNISLPQFLAVIDRGDFTRPLETWRRMFSDYFEPVVFEPYDVGVFGICLWKFVYFKGKARI
jgi:SAM-dependent methyltransferase